MTTDAPASARKKVLYVEDHPVNALLMRALMGCRSELELVVASDGREAMAVAVNLHPALLLLDLRLPDCSGNELLPLLRQIPGCGHAPAVVVTAEPDFETHDTGFAELWPKPLDVAWVLHRLDTLLAPQALQAPLTSPALRPTAHPLPPSRGLWP